LPSMLAEPLAPPRYRTPMSPTGVAPGRCADRLRAVESGDSLLAARLTAGDDRALAELFAAAGHAVYGAAVRVVGDHAVAQDVVQDVFVDLWCHPERYDPALASLRTYLCVRARNRSLDLLRSELRRAARQERRERLNPAEPEPNPAERAVCSATATAVRDAVGLLPPDQRRIVEVAYFGGLSYREAATALGIPEGTAKSRLRLALAKLSNLLDRELLESP
jgi:RNA polymerase sigma-70 factor, ECF subfamily